ncbi:MAG: hypothetical protein HFJ65_02350 [Eggerthellaceae bacterium]|nr:hypothetical protein [Eggerthellaceae bacterium]
MKPTHSSAIRGLNIAIIVLSALTLITAVVIYPFFAANMDEIGEYIADEMYMDYGRGDYYDYGYDYDYDLDDLLDDYGYGDGYGDDGYGYGNGRHHYEPYHHGSAHHTASLARALAPAQPAALMPVDYGYYDYSGNAVFLVGLMLTVLNVLMVWEMIVAVACLLFGILGCAWAGNPQKMKTIFVFGIIGAIVSFLGGHIILTALFVISAILANKDKKEAAAFPPPPSYPVS